MHISVVSPVYKAPKILPELVLRLEKSLREITDSFEVILIDDGCPWDSWSVIEELSKDFNFIKGIKLSRNFGQHNAITAGLDYLTGDWIIVMDCDLQDQPEEIVKLYKKALDGYDIVFAQRSLRKDTLIKVFFSKQFNRVFSFLSGYKRDSSIANFGIYSKQVVEQVRKIREPFRIFTPMVYWVGFNKTTVTVEHSERFEGDSSYDFFKLFSLSLDILVAYSDKPLKMSIFLGLLISCSSLVFAFYNIYFYLIGTINQPGFTSLIFSIWFLSGIILLTIGILSLYLAKTFETVKQRPLYIIEKKI